MNMLHIIYREQESTYIYKYIYIYKYCFANLSYVCTDFSNCLSRVSTISIEQLYQVAAQFNKSRWQWLFTILYETRSCGIPFERFINLYIIYKKKCRFYNILNCINMLYSKILIQRIAFVDNCYKHGYLQKLLFSWWQTSPRISFLFCCVRIALKKSVGALRGTSPTFCH